MKKQVALKKKAIIEVSYMENGLQIRLKHLMQERNLRTSDLEKLSGIKTSGVRNILLGKTKHPKAETLQAIAEVLGCSIAELLGKEDFTQGKALVSPKVEDPQLLLEAAKSLVSLLEKEGGGLTLDQACSIIKETYVFATQNDSKNVDQQFVRWFFSKQKHSS